MGLIDLLTRAASSRAHVLVAEVPGAFRERVAVERALDRMGWCIAESAAVADVLAVVGMPGDALAEVIEQVWAQMSEPRARLQVRVETETQECLAGAYAQLRGAARRLAGPDVRRGFTPSAEAMTHDEGDHDGDQDGAGNDHSAMMLYRRVPAAQKAVRAGVYAAKEALVLGFVKKPALMDRLAGLSKAHLDKQVADPELRRRLTPDYTLGCKRLVPSNRWYPALQKPKVELVSSALAEIRPNSVVDGDGVERQVDTIIFGTGYHVTDIPVAAHLRGRHGRTLAEHWAGSPRAYLGASVPGFPNLFLMLGPNTGLGHSSMVYMIESQIAHVRNQVQAMDAAGATVIEVDQRVHDAYNRDVDERMSTTVWEVGGCRSFYIDATGRNATLWPDWTWRFRRLAKRREPTAYLLTRSATTGRGVVGV